MNKQQMLERMEQLYRQAESWPRWKKEYFNEYIATSAHARKVDKGRNTMFKSVAE